MIFLENLKIFCNRICALIECHDDDVLVLFFLVKILFLVLVIVFHENSINNHEYFLHPMIWI